MGMKWGQSFSLQFWTGVQTLKVDASNSSSPSCNSSIIISVKTTLRYRRLSLEMQYRAIDITYYPNRNWSLFWNKYTRCLRSMIILIIIININRLNLLLWVMCLWVSSNSWCGVHHVPPWTARFSSCRLGPAASFTDSIHLTFAFLFSCCLLSFHLYCLFQRTLPSHDVPEVGQLQFCRFCSQRCFRFNLLPDPHVPLSGGPRYLWSSSTARCFKWISCLPICLLYCPAF